MVEANLFSLKGKWALVTGASRGLGKAIALGLAGQGANVVLSATKRESLEAVAKDVENLGLQAVVKTCDMSDTAAIRKLFQALDGETRGVDILVNNAGIIRRSPAVDFSETDWDEVLTVNLKSVFVACQEAGKRMIKKGRGKIINIASLLSFSGGLTVPAYAASKGGVAQLTKALANEWASKGVNVNAIAPGYFKTDNTAALQNNPERYKQISERIPAGHWGEPEDLQGAAIFLASAASDYVHGHVLTVDGGWMAR